MAKFLFGLIVGVFVGVLVIAPNPSLSQKVDNLWTDAKTWAGALLNTAEDVTERAGDLGEQAGQELEEAGRKAGQAIDEATQDPQQ